MAWLVLKSSLPLFLLFPGAINIHSIHITRTPPSRKAAFPGDSASKLSERRPALLHFSPLRHRQVEKWVPQRDFAKLLTKAVSGKTFRKDVIIRPFPSRVALPTAVSNEFCKLLPGFQVLQMAS